jgi:hypothetical protein
MTDIVGQINKQQMSKTVKRAALAGLLAILIVVEADLPAIVEATTPAGVVLAIVISQAISFLKSGKEIKV